MVDVHPLKLAAFQGYNWVKVDYFLIGRTNHLADHKNPTLRHDWKYRFKSGQLDIRDKTNCIPRKKFVKIYLPDCENDKAIKYSLGFVVKYFNRADPKKRKYMKRLMGKPLKVMNRKKRLAIGTMQKRLAKEKKQKMELAKAARMEERMKLAKARKAEAAKKRQEKKLEMEKRRERRKEMEVRRKERIRKLKMTRKLKMRKNEKIKKMEMEEGKRWKREMSKNKKNEATEKTVEIIESEEIKKAKRKEMEKEEGRRWREEMKKVKEMMEAEEAEDDEVAESFESAKIKEAKKKKEQLLKELEQEEGAKWKADMTAAEKRKLMEVGEGRRWMIEREKLERGLRMDVNKKQINKEELKVSKVDETVEKAKSKETNNTEMEKAKERMLKVKEQIAKSKDLSKKLKQTAKKLDKSKLSDHKTKLLEKKEADELLRKQKMAQKLKLKKAEALVKKKEEMEKRKQLAIERKELREKQRKEAAIQRKKDFVQKLLDKREARREKRRLEAEKSIQSDSPVEADSVAVEKASSKKRATRKRYFIGELAYNAENFYSTHTIDLSIIRWRQYRQAKRGVRDHWLLIKQGDPFNFAAPEIREAIFAVAQQAVGLRNEFTFECKKFNCSTKASQMHVMLRARGAKAVRRHEFDGYRFQLTVNQHKLEVFMRKYRCVFCKHDNLLFSDLFEHYKRAHSAFHFIANTAFAKAAIFACYYGVIPAAESEAIVNMYTESLPRSKNLTLHLENMYDGEDGVGDGVTSGGVTDIGVTNGGVTYDGVTNGVVTNGGVTYDGVTNDGVTSDGVADGGIETRQLYDSISNVKPYVRKIGVNPSRVLYHHKTVPGQEHDYDSDSSDDNQTYYPPDRTNSKHQSILHDSRYTENEKRMMILWSSYIRTFSNKMNRLVGKKDLIPYLYSFCEEYGHLIIQSGLAPELAALLIAMKLSKHTVERIEKIMARKWKQPNSLFVRPVDLEDHCIVNAKLNTARMVDFSKIGRVQLGRAAPKAGETVPKTVEVVPEVADPGADVAHPKADVAHSKADVAHPKAYVANPKADVAHPKADVADPGADVAHPKADVVHPKAGVAHPKAYVADPGANVADTDEADPSAEGTDTEAARVDQESGARSAKKRSHERRSSLARSITRSDSKRTTRSGHNITLQ